MSSIIRTGVPRRPGRCSPVCPRSRRTRPAACATPTTGARAWPRAHARRQRASEAALAPSVVRVRVGVGPGPFADDKAWIEKDSRKSASTSGTGATAPRPPMTNEVTILR